MISARPFQINFDIPRVLPLMLIKKLNTVMPVINAKNGRPIIPVSPTDTSPGPAIRYDRSMKYVENFTVLQPLLTGIYFHLLQQALLMPVLLISCIAALFLPYRAVIQDIKRT